MSEERERAVLIPHDLPYNSITDYFNKFHDTSIHLSEDESIFIRGKYTDEDFYAGKIVVIRETDEEVPGTENNPPLKYYEIVNG